MPNLTIAASGTTSDSLTLDLQKNLVILFPAEMTGTSVAIHGSFNGSDFFPIYNEGFPLAVAFVASSMHVIQPVKLLGITAIRLVSNATESSARTIGVNATRAV